MVKVIKPKPITIDYAKLAFDAKNNDNLINKLIKSKLPVFTNSAYSSYTIFSHPLNMKCFTVNENGLLIFKGSIGLLKK